MAVPAHRCRCRIPTLNAPSVKIVYPTTRDQRSEYGAVTVGSYQCLQWEVLGADSHSFLHLHVISPILNGAVKREERTEGGKLARRARLIATGGAARSSMQSTWYLSFAGTLAINTAAVGNIR